jgi:hypothetical protein
MRTAAHAAPVAALGTATAAAAAEHTSSYQAYRILHAGFTILPVLAGLDKFTNVLVDWSRYLPGFVGGLTGGHPQAFLYVVGVIEIAAGLGVALRPRLFSWVVAAWLWAIIVNLLLIPGYFDVAVRDFGLSLGALALAQLSREFTAPRAKN